MVEKKKESKIDFYRLIVAVSLPDSFKNKKIIWGKEIKLAKKLVEKFPERDFWESFIPQKSNRFTLTYYLTDMGLKELDSHLLKMNLKEETPVEEVKIYKEKFGENKEIKKEKDIYDFLS